MHDQNYEQFHGHKRKYLICCLCQIKSTSIQCYVTSRALLCFVDTVAYILRKKLWTEAMMSYAKSHVSPILSKTDMFLGIIESLPNNFNNNPGPPLPSVTKSTTTKPDERHVVLERNKKRVAKISRLSVHAVWCGIKLANVMQAIALELSVVRGLITYDVHVD